MRKELSDAGVPDVKQRRERRCRTSERDCVNTLMREIESMQTQCSSSSSASRYFFPSCVLHLYSFHISFYSCKFLDDENIMIYLQFMSVQSKRTALFGLEFGSERFSEADFVEKAP